MKFAVVGAYVVLTYWLSVRGMRRTTSLKGFAVGNGDMGPVLVGLTMAASIASTATFVINPGFVYAHGFSAFLHYGPSALLGMAAALIVLSSGFQRFGSNVGALTVPHWILSRYGSRALALFFAGMSLLSITFIVLILVGCALLSSALFGISQHAALIGVFLFVLSYVLMGGSYAHAYTNAFQGVIMAVISVVVFASGWRYWPASFFESLASVSPDYAAAINPSSSLYSSFFSVFASGFIVTFALMMQPHILTKLLYLKSNKDVNKFLATTLIAAGLFSLMLFTGFHAKMAGITIARQDLVVVSYIQHAFGATGFSLVSVALLAAGMSTLDGILVALSTMVVNDLYLPLRGNKRSGLALSRGVLVAIGLVSLALAWNPPKLVGLFAQQGVYGMAAASFVPILFGVLYRDRMPASLAGGSAVLGLAAHLIMNLGLGVKNPAVSAAWAILMSAVGARLMLILFDRSQRPGFEAVSSLILEAHRRPYKRTVEAGTVAINPPVSAVHRHSPVAQKQAEV